LSELAASFEMLGHAPNGHIVVDSIDPIDVPTLASRAWDTSVANASKFAVVHFEFAPVPSAPCLLHFSSAIKTDATVSGGAHD
jgi:hypothetical protein